MIVGLSVDGVARNKAMVSKLLLPSRCSRIRMPR